MDDSDCLKTCSHGESTIKRLLAEGETKRVLEYLQTDESEEGLCIDPLPLVSTVCLAVRCGDVNLLRAVVDRGFSPDEPSEEERGVRILPVHIAICLRMTDVTKVLIEEYNVQRNIGKYKTGRALFWAICSESLDMVKYLVDHGEFLKSFCLHTCIDMNQRSICEYIVNKVNPNSKDQAGQTPMYRAVTQGRGDIVGILLKAGADMGGVFSRGNTLLHQAVISGDPKTVQILCTSGADPKVPNKSGNSALHLASLYGFYDIARYLVHDLCVDLCVTDVDDQTPFVLALHGRNIPIARMLVWAGYRPSEQDIMYLFKSLKSGKQHGTELGSLWSLQALCIDTIRQCMNT